MSDQPKRQWGVTNAISEARPSKQDLELNDELVEALVRENNFETPEGTELRWKVLAHIENVVQEFIRRVCKAKGLAPSVVDNAGGKIFQFGSFALGVYGPGSDIDTLVVAPKHVFRDDFFQHFPPTFHEMSAAEDVTEFNPVPGAYVPIIKMEYRGVSIDLIFVSLPTMSSIPKDLILTEMQLLRGLDDTSMRAVNGTRVTSELMSAVPEPKAFRHATRTIKLWANKRGIYGAVFGFPGGIAWAIMVARICQLYPHACGATILSKFFNLMIKWPWPRPIMLKTIEEGTMGLRVWNPQIYPQDRAHLLPIITPAFPSMCATHNVMHSTMKIMLQEFERADAIVNGVYAGKQKWGDLFEPDSFFTKDYKYYLSVIAASRTKEAHNSFSGLVQSKVNKLVKELDNTPSGVALARPYIKSFDRFHRCKTEEEVDRVIQGNLDYQITEEEAASANGSNGETTANDFTVYTRTFYIGLALSVEPGKQLDISSPVQEFKRIVMTTDSYDPDTMSVRIVHTRNYDLPEDCFRPGETRPVKEKKKKSHTKTAKRSFAETGLPDNEQNSSKRRQSVNANGVAAPTPA